MAEATKKSSNVDEKLLENVQSEGKKKKKNKLQFTHSHGIRINIFKYSIPITGTQKESSLWKIKVPLFRIRSFFFVSIMRNHKMLVSKNKK